MRWWTPASNKRLRALLKDPKKIESVSKAFQRENVSLLDMRVWYDGLIAIKPYYATYLAMCTTPRTDIVHSSDFESGCVRVLGGNASRLTGGDKAA
ncbi:hypothetical protein PR003_g28520 [Phytophthora rubi]|uniref:Uncharacterized protein n=1 Tax=Phytophthora rubi TaxID=129364 RepID=A0A6A4BUY8_9STRA|nr:hypothetical protein PR003_g28520 [Phytophthora rubi]